ncbi:MAG: response regulator [Cytophagales bacterium]|nr:MAG: response regulator [Cytophagales bacterium]
MDEFLVKVLVIDDDSSVLFLHKIIIKSENLHPSPLTFSNPEKGLEFILQNDSKGSKMLIFLDINMPRLSGWELLDQLESQITQADVKVIMVTSSLDKKDREKANNYDFVIDFWEKPLDDQNISELKERLGDWLI